MEGDLKALNAAAVRAMASGSFERAIQLLDPVLKEVAILIPGPIYLNLAAAYRGVGAIDSALAVLEKALGKEPRYLPALLMKGSLQEVRGDRRAAALAYGQALQVRPAGQVEVSVVEALSHAERYSRRYSGEMRKLIGRRVPAILDAGVDGAEYRIKLFVDNLLGFRRI